MMTHSAHLLAGIWPGVWDVVTVLAMCAVTYATRIGGYLFLRNRSFSPRVRAMMECAPGCVLITVISPDFVTTSPASLLALGITAVAASRLPMLPTVVIGMASAALLRMAL